MATLGFMFSNYSNLGTYACITNKNQPKTCKFYVAYENFLFFFNYYDILQGCVTYTVARCDQYQYVCVCVGNTVWYSIIYDIISTVVELMVVQAF